MSRSKIIVIVGATASGKTALAIKIAQKFNGEIVSADSCQIYKEMDIGTAKPTRKELTAIPHHLIDIKNPNQNYTVAKYKQDAIKAIRKIVKKGKLPILVGGTGLYIKAVIDNLKIPKVKPDQKLRKNLELRIRNYGLKSVYDELIKLDPEAAYIIDPNNPRRIIRALEIAIKTNKPFSKQRKTGRPLFDFLEIGIKQPKKKLNARINQRVDEMIKNGLLEEVKKIIKKYPPPLSKGGGLKSFDAIGYREIINYIKNRKCGPFYDRQKNCKFNPNNKNLEEIKDLIKKNTRRYAKRQMTWFRKDKRIHWIKNLPANGLSRRRWQAGEKEAEKLVNEFLNLK